jgi:hypothetical protein
MSDGLAALVGLLPFGLAPVLVAVVFRSSHAWRIARAGLVVELVAVATWAIALRVAGTLGFVTVAPERHFATTAELGKNAALLWNSVFALAGGQPFGQLVSTQSLIQAALGLLTLVALTLVLVAVWLRPNDRQIGNGSIAHTLYRGYWSVAVGIVTLAFVFSDVPIDNSSSRYLVLLVYAVAAAMPLIAQRGRVISAVLLVAASTYGFVNVGTLGRAIDSGVLRSGDLQPTVAYLESTGVTIGYASYWQANSLTWISNGRIHSYGVLEGEACGSNDPGALCPHNFNSISSWYQPRPTTRSFVIQDSGAIYVTSPPSDSLGTPLAVHRMGQLTVYLYDHDVAADFARR